MKKTDEFFSISSFLTQEKIYTIIIAHKGNTCDPKSSIIMLMTITPQLTEMFKNYHISPEYFECETFNLYYKYEKYVRATIKIQEMPGEE